MRRVPWCDLQSRYRLGREQSFIGRRNSYQIERCRFTEPLGFEARTPDESHKHGNALLVTSKSLLSCSAFSCKAGSVLYRATMHFLTTALDTGALLHKIVPCRVSFPSMTHAGILLFTDRMMLLVLSQETRKHTFTHDGIACISLLEIFGYVVPSTCYSQSLGALRC